MANDLPFIDVPGGTLFDIVARQARRVPERLAFELIGQRRTTYRELLEEARSLAAFLVARGVGPGARVVLMANNRVEFPVFLIACARIGAVFVPLVPALRGPVLRGMLERADPAVVFAERDWRDRIAAEWRGQLCTLPPPDAVHERAWPLAAADVPLPAPPAPTSLCLLLFTSGTTGQSKGVMWAHATVSHMAASLNAMNGLGEGDVLHTALPIAHGNGLILTVFAALALGATAVVSPRFSASSFDRELAASKATITNILGAMSHIVLEQPAAADATPRLAKAFVIPVSPETQAALEARYGCAILSGYGLSDAGLPLLTGPGFPGGACGRLLEQIWEARLVDPEGREVPAGKSGELQVRARVERASAFGYWGMAAETAERYRDGWIATGDLFRRSEDGWYFFLDRAKDAIRRRGENISSQEVEEVVLAHPAVADCAVYPVPSEMSEDEVMLAAVAKEGRPVPPAELLAAIEGKLPYFAVPRYVRWLDALPRTETQKVQKAALREEGITADTWDREKAGYRVSR